MALLGGGHGDRRHCARDRRSDDRRRAPPLAGRRDPARRPRPPPAPPPVPRRGRPPRRPGRGPRRHQRTDRAAPRPPGLMRDVFIAVALAELLVVAPLLVPLARGPHVSDRIVPLNTISTQAALSLLFFAAYADRTIYLDVALWLASFRYLGTI